MSHVRITGMRPHRESDPCGLPFNLSNVSRRPVLIGIPCPAGMTRGGHFHTGEEGRHKSPEIVFVVMGTLKLVTQRVDKDGNLDGLEQHTIAHAGMKIKIPTFVRHTFTAQTDALLVEYCYTPDDVSREAR